jgi:GNAT superfamily N-acetyltransferase
LSAEQPLVRLVPLPAARDVSGGERTSAQWWRQAYRLECDGSRVGTVHCEEAVATGEGQGLVVAALDFASPAPAEVVAAALRALIVVARERSADFVEMPLPDATATAVVEGLAAAGFRRRPVDLFVLPLAGLPALLERLRHPRLPAGFTLRPPRHDERDRLVSLLAAFHAEDGNPISDRELARAVDHVDENAGPGRLVLASGADLAGTVSLGVAPGADGERHGTIADYYVAPAHRRRGLGAALFAEVLRRLDAAGATVACGWVAQGNPAAQRFWQAHATRAAAALWLLPLDPASAAAKA